MDNVYVRLVDLPPRVNEMVVPCLDGYSIYIDANLTEEAQRSAYYHAIRHITHNDFEYGDVQEIEIIAHSNEQGGILL